MPFHCFVGDTPHQHETVAELRAAHDPARTPASAPVTSAPPTGTMTPVPAPVPAEAVSAPPSPTPAPARPVESVWERRQREIKECGAKSEFGLPYRDDRLALIKGLIDYVPDGYYATQSDDTATVNFIRISRPTRGKWLGHVKIQTQHSEHWENRLALMPDGIWLVMDGRVVDALMLLVADHHTCARRYAIEIQACCVCNTSLTDDRSRHYLIGPICDQKPQWKYVIEEVDDLNLGLSYEDLVARGLPTRVWQDRELARINGK